MPNLTNVLLSLVAAGAALGAMALADGPKASAEPAPGDLVTVDSNTFPVCAVEDCSDQPNQIGVWIDPDNGNAWLSLGERSYPIER
ncbi:membrane protein [Mycobacterium phage Steamy]|uniref:Membrane protein n=1 Tax=Mycobacterium phage Steamy TaxID=2250309 RepID=A0A345L0Q7_9CAUD|nr:membrane protein [Mycobacterium phage Steamy]AXH48859.1 membrane protein [Mycobacterium phage Steamy]